MVDGGQKRVKLMEQVEYYFCPKNLQTDDYLYGKMDEKLRVPIGVVANFPRIKEMSPSEEELISVIKESSKLHIDGEGSANVLISPKNIKPALRTTLIIREIPTDVTDAELEAIFSSKPVAIRREINDTRFVQFATEEEALEMHRAAVSAKLRGKPVRARLKNESISINMLVAKHEVAQNYPRHDPFSGYRNEGHGDGGQNEWMFGMPPYPYGVPPPFPMYPNNQYYPHQHHHHHHHHQHHQHHHQHQHIKGGKGGKKGPPPSGRGGRKGGHHGTAESVPITPKFTAEDFPALVPSDWTGLYESKDVIRWTTEDIITTLKDYKDKLANGSAKESKPDSLPSTSVCPVLLSEPDYSLALTEPVPVKEEQKKTATPKKEDLTPVSEPAPASSAPKSFAEAVVTATDCRVPTAPFLQYRAGISGGTVVVPGGSSQHRTKEKKTDEPKGKGGRGASGKGRGGRGAGEGRGGKGRGGKRKEGTKGKGDAAKTSVSKPAETKAAVAAPAASAPVQDTVGTWAAVAKGLSSGPLSPKK
eukprot:TRINITY_DN27563_c0_g1_i1.p1 TRINITY_DN27563_c0_g1~~TRINITY_DN27563_c0_g1_i1.p1  ORF type:complete len:531 (+),score=115.55 TRINITY_DN27563_c0_g1_i1:58-1650(+)